MGLLTLTEMAERARIITGSVDIPIIADAEKYFQLDTHYKGLCK